MTIDEKALEAAVQELFTRDRPERDAGPARLPWPEQPRGVKERYRKLARVAILAYEAAKPKGEVVGCERCHGRATHRADFPSGSNYLCSGCIAQGESESDEVDAHEMREFGGAYGLVPRATYVRLASSPSIGDTGVTEDGWRDIASAPRDGTHVLIADEDDMVTEARWLDEDGQWWRLNNDPSDHWGEALSPVAWQPMPAPPASAMTSPEALKGE